MKTIPNISVRVKDFNPESEDFKDENFHFKRGVAYAVKKFRETELSEKVLDGLYQYPNESEKDYLSRLRGIVVDCMCSNAGYASCFNTVKPNK